MIMLACLPSGNQLDIMCNEAELSMINQEEAWDSMKKMSTKLTSETQYVNITQDKI